jgi:hypothetical protein
MDKLPVNAEEGTRVWLWSAPGVGWQYERMNGVWVAVAGCNCPYIPQMKDGTWVTTQPK